MESMSTQTSDPKRVTADELYQTELYHKKGDIVPPNINFTGKIIFTNSPLAHIAFFVEGKLHREDGPAIVSAVDVKYDRYFLDGDDYHGRLNFYGELARRYKDDRVKSSYINHILAVLGAF
jgi:hypothetical protein